MTPLLGFSGRLLSRKAKAWSKGKFYFFPTSLSEGQGPSKSRDNAGCTAGPAGPLLCLRLDWASAPALAPDTAPQLP